MPEETVFRREDRRQGVEPVDHWRIKTEEDMNPVLASVFFLGVRALGERYAEKESINPVIISP